MRTLPVLLLRLLLELALVPVRLLLGLIGGTAILFGAIGTIAWLIQIVIGGRSGAPLPADLMWLMSVAAVPAGLLLLTVAHAGSGNQPPTNEPTNEPKTVRGSLGTPQPVLSSIAERTTTVDPKLRTTVRVRLAESRQVRQRRASRRATRHRVKRRPS